MRIPLSLDYRFRRSRYGQSRTICFRNAPVFGDGPVPSPDPAD